MPESTKPRRRFPPPWSIAEYNDACFIVSDHNGQALAYVYFEDKPGRRAAANLLTKDKGRRIALNIAKLPDLLRKLIGNQRRRSLVFAVECYRGEFSDVALGDYVLHSGNVLFHMVASAMRFERGVIVLDLEQKHMVRVFLRDRNCLLPAGSC